MHFQAMPLIPTPRPLNPPAAAAALEAKYEQLKTTMLEWGARAKAQGTSGGRGSYNRRVARAAGRAPWRQGRALWTQRYTELTLAAPKTACRQRGPPAEGGAPASGGSVRGGGKRWGNAPFPEADAGGGQQGGKQQKPPRQPREGGPPKRGGEAGARAGTGESEPPRWQRQRPESGGGRREGVAAGAAGHGRAVDKKQGSARAAQAAQAAASAPLPSPSSSASVADGAGDHGGRAVASDERTAGGRGPRIREEDAGGGRVAPAVVERPGSSTEEEDGGKSSRGT